MASSYCPHCGFKNMYSLQAPKFCGGCGEPLSLLTAAKQTSAKPAKTPKTPARPSRKVLVDTDDSEDPDGTDVYQVPDIQGLAYNIEMNKNTFKLSDVLPKEIIDESKAAQEKPKTKKAKRGRPRKK